MKRVYFIDSENVGDNWLSLLKCDEDEILVFYTTKTPYMNYESLIQLKESPKEVNFIKCFEGANALDFQLVSELGYRLRDNSDNEFIIVTNDTGFDAVVRYWQSRDYSVKRIAGKLIKGFVEETYGKDDVENLEGSEPLDMKESGYEQKASSDEAVEIQESLETDSDVTQGRSEVQKVTKGRKKTAGRSKNGKIKPESRISEVGTSEVRTSEVGTSEVGTSEVGTSEVGMPEVGTSEDDISSDRSEAENTNAEAKQKKGRKPKNGGKTRQTGKNTENDSEFDREEVNTVIECIGRSNLADLHNSLELIYGEKGKEIYQVIKSNSYEVEPKNWNNEDRFIKYCEVVFANSELKNASPKGVESFLYSAEDKRKNLNSLRAALQSEYGKDKGLRIYSIFKAHIKLMNRM